MSFIHPLWLGYFGEEDEEPGKTEFCVNEVFECLRSIEDELGLELQLQLNQVPQRTTERSWHLGRCEGMSIDFVSGGVYLPYLSHTYSRSAVVIAAILKIRFRCSIYFDRILSIEELIKEKSVQSELREYLASLPECPEWITSESDGDDD